MCNSAAADCIARCQSRLFKVIDLFFAAEQKIPKMNEE
jgi:hypothetical protein